MSRILLAWELGANYGHVGALRAYAHVLRDAGHDCLFAVRDLGSAQVLGLHELGPVLPAPFAPGTRRAVAVQTSYATLLHNTGFDDSAALASRLRAWQTLYQTLSIDAVALNYAPTATLAARQLRLPRSTFGASFGQPPLQQPFPWFQPSRPVNHDALIRNEARVLATVNDALARLSWSPLASLQALFDDCPQCILSFAELDTYGPGRETLCLGHPDYSHGDAPIWPDGQGSRLFAYLRPGPWLQLLLEVLRELPITALLRVADVSPSAVRAYLRPGLAIATGAIDLHRALQECDIAIHAGQDGTSSETLLAGKPAMLLPTDVEKALIARRILQLGAGVMPVARKAADLRTGLTQLLDNPALRRNAEAFANRYRMFDRAQVMPRAAQQLLRQL
ncbi:glycosyltransferase [Solimonas terrae]|uniref:Erythromycin biosynthesis protein CIII-like C-terminal domain-containing protein n=1 Tax=Solimonas terrae TaxID=1396819 RepID=A0A6M2BQW6_9GAMM|nr:nucleotide disphospho-sugar-binding domain-containing protein [Solimonas terrae]NGY04611.1 hypothetical protein [Solimonas terrae]